MKKQFIIIATIGVITISIISLIIFSIKEVTTITIVNIKIPLWICSIISGLSYLLILKSIFKIINKRKRTTESIIKFTNSINKAFNKNHINTKNEITFNRYIKFQNQIIPLGKIIIDNENYKIFFYETFFQAKEKTLCLPDIRCFNFNQLAKCELYNNNETISIKELNELFINNKINFNNITMTIKTKDYDFLQIDLKLSSINDFETFKNIYNSLKNAIKTKLS